MTVAADDFGVLVGAAAAVDAHDLAVAVLVVDIELYKQGSSLLMSSLDASVGERGDEWNGHDCDFQLTPQNHCCQVFDAFLDQGIDIEDLACWYRTFEARSLACLTSKISKTSRRRRRIIYACMM